MASFSISSITTTSAMVRVSGLVAGDEVRIYVRTGSTTILDSAYTATGTTVTETLSGLTPGTEYTVNVKYVDDSLPWWGAKSFTTDEETTGAEYSFDILIPTSIWVGVVVYGVSVGDSVRVLIRESDSTAAIYDVTHTADANPFYIEQIGDLTPATYYAINVKVNGGAWLGTIEFRTNNADEGEDHPTRPNNWSWVTTVEKGSEISLTAAEWNAFCNRINAFREYAGTTKYSFTIAVSGETEISAIIVNEAIDAIADIGGHGALPSYATKGKNITASFFNDLKDALNNVS